MKKLTKTQSMDALYKAVVMVNNNVNYDQSIKYAALAVRACVNSGCDFDSSMILFGKDRSNVEVEYSKLMYNKVMNDIKGLS